MNDTFDFNSYNKLEDISGYDGFIDPNGEFYRVKKKNSSDINFTHLTWSDAYLKYDTKKLSVILKPSYSMLYILSQLKTKQDILIQVFGFVYYSHDHFTHEPIIIPPDPMYNDKSITSEQLDKLYEIMEMNKENPLNHQIFNDSMYYKEFRRR